MRSITDDLQPVIILGAGRSGTKFFRDTLLASDEACAVPYDVNYIWRYGNESLQHDELQVKHCSDRTKNYIQSCLFRFAKRQNPDAKYLLEKTVSNGLRVEFIQKVFPNAVFIHLVRDGRAVTESALRMWNKPPESGYLIKKLKYFPWRNYRYAISYIASFLKGKFTKKRGQEIWGPKYKGIYQDLQDSSLLEVCASQWKECVVSADESLRQIPSHRVLTIKYEDYIDSIDTLVEVLDFIGIEDRDRVLKQYSESRRVENLDKWKGRFSESEMNILSVRLGDALKRFDYV